MARTDLAVQEITIAGLDPAYTAANVDGHAVVNQRRAFLHVKNGSAASVTVTVVTPLTVGGRAVADDAVAIPASGERMIGPFDPSVHNGTGVDKGKVHVDFSAVTSVTVAALAVD